MASHHLGLIDDIVEQAYMDAVHAGERKDISESLRKIDDLPPAEQASFWKSLVTGGHKRIGMTGLAPDHVRNDSVTRYFDSSVHGINRVFEKCAHQDGDDFVMDSKDLYRALVSYYHFHWKEMSDFDKVVETIGVPCGPTSFAYAIRRLRIGLLLEFFEAKRTKPQIYDFQYDDDHMYSPFTKSVKVEQWTLRSQTWDVAVPSKQAPVEDVEAYFFRSKLKAKGTVRWVHVHEPSIETLAAIGQVHRMPGHVQSIMYNLGRSVSELKYGSAVRNSWDLHTTDSTHLFSWSSVVFPSIYLTERSKRSMVKYKQWVWDRGQGKMEPPPAIHVHSKQINMACLWSDLTENTFVSICALPVRLGIWTSDHQAPRGDSAFSWMCKMACCRRRKDEDDHLIHQYTKLPQEDSADDLQAAENGVNEDDELLEGTSSTFEENFAQVLNQLEEDHSVLRSGSDVQLLTRILLNRAEEYLDVVGVYEAAITRLAYLLRNQNQTAKDELIAKIEVAKLELAKVLRLVQPFADFVVPELNRIFIGDKRLDPVVISHVKDIQNNIRCFLPQCRALMEKCESLTTEYDRNASDKVNNILNILTFITFVILPLQIMTGIYGMNFKIMPELNWEHGYHYFWGLSLSLTVLFAFILCSITRGQ